MSEAQRRNAEKVRVANEIKREETTEKARKAKNAFVYSTIIVLISTFTLAVFTVGFTVYMSQRWCGLVVLLDDRNKLNPPRTPEQKRFADEISHIRKDFFC